MAAASTITSPRKTMRTACKTSRGACGAKSGLIFANLVDFDMLYGHRKDVEGFAKSLEEFDVLLGPLLKAMSPAIC